MRLTIIGCWGGYPKKNEASTGYLLEHDGFHLLIDCGSGVLAKLQNILEPEKLDGVILSHYHPDHIADIGVLQHARLIQGLLGKKMTNLPIYGHQDNLYEFSKLTYKEITKGVAYDSNTAALTIGSFHVTFLKTNHPVTCYAMRFEAGGKAVVYTADSSYKDEFIGFCKNANLLLCECNFYGHQSGKSAGHMNSVDAGKIASKAYVNQLVLTHLPHYGDINELVREASREYNGIINLAEQFLSITV